MLASAAAVGVALGLAIRRSWRPLLQAQVRWLPLLIGSLLLRSIASFVGDAGFAMYVAALAGTSVAAIVNYKLTGALLVALGGGLNLMVVLLNRGMPVDGLALAAVGAHMPSDALHVPLESSTQFPALADVVPVAVVRSVYSIGDVFIAIGGFFVPLLIFLRR